MMRWNARTRSLILTVPRWRDLRWRRAWAFWLILAFIIAIDVLMAFVDRPLTERMSKLGEGAEQFFANITFLGDARTWLVPLLLVLPFVLAMRLALEDVKARRMLDWVMLALLFVFCALAISGICNNIIRTIIGRTRPHLWLEGEAYGFAPLSFGGSGYRSFPASHATIIFALATALGFFWPRGRKLMYAAAGLIAFSRVALVANYLSDMVAGAVLGTLATIWVHKQFTARDWVFVRHQGQSRIAGPGLLLIQKIRSHIHDRLGLWLGARDRLP